MTISTGPVTPQEALSTAEKIEEIVQKVSEGTLSPKKIPLEPICKLVQYTRDTAPKLPLTPLEEETLKRALAETDGIRTFEFNDPEADTLALILRKIYRIPTSTPPNPWTTST